MTPSLNSSYQFSGHETFPLRQLWLMKVHSLVSELEENFLNYSPSIEDLMLRFGVGKNMVSSMFYWSYASGFIDGNKRPTAIAKIVFGSPTHQGLDPYGESATTSWLVHWNLASTATKCTAFWFLFNCVNTPSISRSDLQDQLIEFVGNRGHKFSALTIKRAIEVCLRSYLPNIACRSKDITEEFVEAYLGDLGLVEPKSRDEILLYRSSRPTLNSVLFAYALLDFWNKNSTNTATLNFHRVMHDIGSPGKVFKLDETSLANYLDSLEQLTDGQILWTEQAGIRSLLRKKDALDNPEVFMTNLLEKALKV